MTKLDSKLLFEVSVDSLKSHIDSDIFVIKCQFANTFTVRLKDPNDIQTISSKKYKCKTKGKRIKEKKQSGRTTLPTNDIDQLILDMQQFPIEISLSSKQSLDNRVGSTLIAWSQVFINYLKKLKMHLEPPPAIICHEYNVFDESTSKLMAAITLNMKMISLKENRIKFHRKKTFNYIKMACSFSNVQLKYPVNSTKLKQTMHVKKSAKESKDEKNKHLFFKNSNVSMDLKDNIVQIKRSINVLSSRSDIFSCKSSKVMLPKKSRSFSNVQENFQLQTLKHIFGDRQGPFGNQVYCVGYVTIDDDQQQSHKAKQQETNSYKKAGPCLDNDSTTYKFNICDKTCLKQAFSQHSAINPPNESKRIIPVKTCKNVTCEKKEHRHVPDPDRENDKILIDMKSMTEPCCTNIKVEEVVGEVKLHLDSDPCTCSCDCKFGFIKRTTYCTVCGGYESAGEDFSKDKLPFDIPYPCPVYHNLIDKNKLKNVSSFGSDSKKKDDISQKGFKGAQKGEKKLSDKAGGQTIGGSLIIGQSMGGGQIRDLPAGGQKGGSHKAVGQTAEAQSTKVTIDTEKLDKKKKKFEKFKINYDYKAPHIGHSKCALPCDGFINPVPKKMGWLWNAEIPGLKFRPNWKPGAAHKHVVRLLKMAKYPGEVLTKRKRKETGKKKKPIKRPLITVHKKDGEFTITMETMKSYNRPRTFNQQPYEDKQPVSYTIGKTEEEKRLRQRKKQREKRRLERAQRMFIQSTFQNLCKDICLKTYQQALGILPDTEKPDCPCFPAIPDAEAANLDVSCSCSEDSLISNSDSDEWILEFTPPNCLYDPTYKVKKVPKSESFAQYSVNDFRVRKLDKHGKEVPKYFKGPDGKQYCSDLGGFRDADGKWHEINVDGFIAPDGRWCPNVFIGPNGEQVDVDNGEFQAGNGQIYEVGVHGYVDASGKWRFYSKPKGDTLPKTNKNVKADTQSKAGDKNTKVGISGDKNTKGGGSGDKNTKTGGTGDKIEAQVDHKPSETFSCFGDASAKYLSKLGIVGHGHDRKLLLSTLKDMIAKGKPVKIPEYTTVPRTPGGGTRRNLAAESKKRYVERIQCKHATPSEKGVLAVDGLGNKTYFRIKECQNTRPKDRVAGLTSQGISLSSFHVPCFNSFINSEYMRQQQCMRILELAQQCKNTATQVN